MGQKFVCKPKGLRVFKNTVLAKFRTEKEYNRTTVYCIIKSPTFFTLRQLLGPQMIEFIYPSTKYKRPLPCYLSYTALRLLRLYQHQFQLS